MAVVLEDYFLERLSKMEEEEIQEYNNSPMK
jgi:hypothetical protein